MDVSLSWPSVCDLMSCDPAPVLHCAGGLQPILTNPGECRPNFTCGKASVVEEGVVQLLFSGLGKVSCMLLSRI